MRMKVLIVVKTYPAISRKYGEIVCTAGITEDGKWIRIYPLPFRRIDYTKRFKKYDWIEIDLIRNTKDFRPESYRPVNFNYIKKIGRINSDGESWELRRKYVLKNVYTNLEQLIKDAKENKTSLAVFKPTKILDFKYIKVQDQWDKKKLEYLESQSNQGYLFENEDINDITQFEVVPKLPYKFQFVFKDDADTEATLSIEDWEIGMLNWNSLKRHNDNEELACNDVKKKYYFDFAKTKDYYFILGTTKKYHLIAKNPFLIIGDFRPKQRIQLSLFD